MVTNNFTCHVPVIFCWLRWGNQYWFP